MLVLGLVLSVGDVVPSITVVEGKGADPIAPYTVVVGIKVGIEVVDLVLAALELRAT